MTGPDGISAVILTTFAFLILSHQHTHRSTTRAQRIRRTEQSHGQDQQPAQNHHTGEEDHREEDDHPDAA